MTTFVLATNGVHVSSTLCDYLDERIEAEDTVHAVNSQRGGDATSAEAVRDGEEALNVVSARLGTVATVDTHQFIRGNTPAADVLQFAEEVDADELVIGVRERSPAGKALFGSVAQKLLLNTDRPVVVVPRE
ncbi:Nucleotide-binding protein, UspA family [Halalkaliarchaeum sp. AArc-CO]|uniref:universal stress protein n=1 Tax=unclassified Halalkaliarchaeum TaxID=2678344 RepID=UPI00217EC498|nr:MULTISPECIES: universal stress protein [unclassified Halalkaliarchaeum]MDR5671813.1 universal stress protein [Halalkaliarchaeum sp. AArc-GB]UWG51315.1 Nucleotide-binding protein, UspA family [Halalkaliarchaeum sp. AArc-CO]